MLMPIVLVALVWTIATVSANQLQAVDIEPENVSPIPDRNIACQVNAVFTHTHQLALDCGKKMRARHERNEREFLQVIQRVGVLGDYRQIAQARHYWAFDFVNFVEQMVGHSYPLTSDIFAKLELRVQLSQHTLNALRQLHEKASSVLKALLLKCRQQVTATVKASISYVIKLQSAASAHTTSSDVSQWQLRLEEYVLSVSEKLRQILEENLEDGYVLLDTFDRLYRKLVAENY